MLEPSPTPSPRRRPGHRLCLHCLAVLSDEEREHYVYACHPCTEAEHDAGALARRDPDHPDATWMRDPPILIEIRTARPRAAAPSRP